ncbi:MAG TPA: glycosyltransferase family A protein, partial [bacterium]|nr:glycosyltransferase family A protein [bacterium]
MNSITVVALLCRENQDLLEGLKTVLAQDVAELDVLVMDLCDSAASKALCAQAQQIDPRVRVIAGKRNNLAQACNAAREASKADYLVNLPANTRFYPGMLKKYVDILAGNTNLAFAYSNFESQKGEEKQLKKLLEDIGDNTEMADFGHVKMFRTACLKEVGGYREDFNHAE